MRGPRLVKDALNKRFGGDITEWREKAVVKGLVTQWVREVSAERDADSDDEPIKMKSPKKFLSTPTRVTAGSSFTVLFKKQ